MQKTQSRALTIREWAVPDRPRERMRSIGASSLATRELLAILVGSGGGGRSAVDVGGGLLHAAESSLRRLATMPPEAMERVPGVGPAVAARVAAALELGRRLAREGPEERPRLKGAGDIYARCAPHMRDLPHEEFRLLVLTTQHAVVRETVITRGVIDASVVHPREVFRTAISENAAAIVLVHNHPSGDPSPSPEDRAVTRQLARAGHVIGIPIVDHVVIGDGRYVSFAETGWL